uniref:Disease resistance protein At4g27190-like leucine-rich repeats domain-containing protein n=1 Tax=Fagus sylvatica TaxID=28930 RepID=A0A2N9GVH5_FAGSY
MHDLIRDMALQIAGPEFIVGLTDFLAEEKWGRDLVKVSLMRNSISEFPYISPRCPKLSSLLLQDNDLCGSIPDPFFVHLRGLNVLDLSNTRIESLPGSVSDLENLSTLRLTQCQNLKHVPSLAKLTALRKLDLMKSRIKEIPHGLEMLVNLRYLGLDAPISEADAGEVLFREEKVASAPAVPPGTFSRLTKFSIFRCPNIKTLFTPGLLPNLGNLEEIDVRCCEQLEEIISGESDEDKEGEAEEEIEEAGMGSNGIFHKLRVLALSDLPELKTICNGSNVIVCDSVQQIWIGQCPKLKRLPLSLPQTNGQLSSPPSSLRIEIKKEWWELLEWGNHDTKNVLEPYCQFFE